MSFQLSNYVIGLRFRVFGSLTKNDTTRNKWNGYENENLISNFTDFKCNLKFEQSGSKYLPFPFNLFGQN